MYEERLTEFSAARLGGRPVPDDLAVLLIARWEGRTEAAEQLELEVLEAGATHHLLDDSWLTARDRANPSLMLTVAAGQRVFEHFRVVAVHQQEHLLGYWFHPEEPADRPAPVILLDSEASYWVMPGRTLTEALAYYYGSRDQKTYAEVRSEFLALGLPPTPESLTEITVPTPALHPEAALDAYEEELRVSRGLA